MNPEYFAQEVKLAAIKAKESYFYSDIKAQIVASVSMGKKDFTVKTIEPIPSNVLDALSEQGIKYAGETKEGDFRKSKFSILESLVNL